MEIIIEGMDGVGKTTVAKKLCERHNFKYVDRPLLLVNGFECKKDALS